MPETITGIIQQISFHNDDTGWSVLRVETEADFVTVVGAMPSVREGEHIRAAGRWVVDRTWGEQFRADRIDIVAPDTVEGVRRYLSSGLVKGVGKGFARKIVDKFGVNLFHVIENEPEKLRTIKGLGKAKADQIVESWRGQKESRDTMIFLQSYGITSAQAVRICKVWGNAAVQKISDNPYLLVSEIRGIGFATADEIAKRLGVDRSSPMRARAGLIHVLTEAERRGHCGLPREELVAEAERILAVPRELIEEGLRPMLREGVVILGKSAGIEVVFQARLFLAEERIAAALAQLAEGDPPWDDEALQAPAAVDTLSPSQREALRRVLDSKVSVVTGGPGVGKTTLVRTLLEILEGREIRLAAPTGRAARRLAEATGGYATTIHRLLEFNPHLRRFTRDESNPIECDVLIVDEASMIDVPLMDTLLRAVPPEAALILVGDVDQLPSVGPGQLLSDVISSGAITVVHLTEIFRQSAESAIVRSAHRINAGLVPDLDARDGDFFFARADDPARTVSTLVKIVCERIPEKFGLDPVRDIQVLVPMHKGEVGTEALNRALQSRLNPGEDERGVPFREGDKVMQIENDHELEVYNGDIGIVRGVDRINKKLLIDFDDHRVVCPFADSEKLVLAYATSIHKSQGSEYPAVVIALTTQHHIMLQRRLLYTAVTRGKKLVVIVGNRRAIEIAVESRMSSTKRWSRLADLLGKSARAGAV